MDAVGQQIHIPYGFKRFLLRQMVFVEHVHILDDEEYHQTKHNEPSDGDKIAYRLITLRQQFKQHIAYHAADSETHQNKHH